MRVKTAALVAVSVLFAAACTSLGFWQIRRLHEKQNYNAGLAARRFLPAIPFDSIPKDSLQSKFRRVRFDGKYDYANQVVWTLRGRDGSPGVNILTPMVRAGIDTAVLINRGWVYSPDATSVDLTAWTEGDSVHGEGYILPLHTTSTHSPTPAGRAFRTLDAQVLGKAFPYPIAPIFVVLTSVSSDSAHTPPRVSLVPLDEGSHRSYAFQWFSFAVISIIGAGIFTRKT